MLTFPLLLLLALKLFSVKISCGNQQSDVLRYEPSLSPKFATIIHESYIILDVYILPSKQATQT